MKLSLPLKDLMLTWCDFDITLHYIASCLGIVDDFTHDCFLKNKGLYWSNNSTNRYLTFILDSLIEQEYILQNDEELFKWNDNEKSI